MAKERSRHIQGYSWKRGEGTNDPAHRATCSLAGGLSGWGHQISSDWFSKLGSGWPRAHDEISTHIAPKPLVTAMPMSWYRSPKLSRGQNTKYSRSVSHNSICYNLKININTPTDMKFMFSDYMAIF